MENCYKSNIAKIGEKFDLDEKKIRAVIAKGLDLGMFDVIAQQSEDMSLGKIKKDVHNNYDISDANFALKAQKILTPYFQKLQSKEQMSINVVAKRYGLRIKELRDFLGCQLTQSPTEIPNGRISKNKRARWIVANPFLSKNEGPALVTSRIPEIISAFLKNYLLNAGNNKPIRQCVLFNVQMNNPKLSIRNSNNAGGVDTFPNSFYLFDKISFLKNAMNRFLENDDEKNKQADKRTNGQIVGFFKNHLTKSVDIITATQQGILVLVQRRDNPELLRKWRSDARIREFRDEEKMFVLDIPITVEVGRDDERPTKRTKSDNSIDSIPQFGRSNKISLDMINTLQVMLFELFVTYHAKHHDDAIPLYVKYSDVSTLAAPNAHKFMIQLGIPPIALHCTSDAFESIRLSDVSNVKGQRKYPRQLMGDLNDAAMEEVLQKITHRNSWVKKKKRLYELETRNVYLRFLGFIDEELFESVKVTLNDMPGIADFSAISRYFRDRDDCISKRKDAQQAKMKTLLQLPEGVKVADYLQDLEKQYEELQASERKTNRDFVSKKRDLARKAQEIWDKADAVFIAIDQDPDTGNGGNGREMAGLRADVQEFCTLHPSSQAETLIGLGYGFLLQMYISQQQNDKYMGATSNFVERTLEQGSFFFSPDGDEAGIDSDDEK